MVKRKAPAPQRLCVERQSELTWNLMENDDPIIIEEIDRSCHDLHLQNELPKEKQNTKRQRRKSKKEDEVTDKILKSLLDDSSFYIAIKKDPGLNNGEHAFHLGKLTLKVKNFTEKFPDGEYWLYISECKDRSWLYIEGVNGIQFFVIDGILDYQLYSGKFVMLLILPWFSYI